MTHISVWHPEKLILTLQRARTSLSLPQNIFVNGKHILIDGNTQKETRTSNKKSTFFMSHTDALYQSEENAPLVIQAKACVKSEYLWSGSPRIPTKKIGSKILGEPGPGYQDEIWKYLLPTKPASQPTYLGKPGWANQPWPTNLCQQTWTSQPGPTNHGQPTYANQPGPTNLYQPTYANKPMPTNLCQPIWANIWCDGNIWLWWEPKNLSQKGKKFMLTLAAQKFFHLKVQNY